MSYEPFVLTIAKSNDVFLRPHGEISRNKMN